MSFQLSRPKNSRGGRQSSWRGDEFLPRVDALISEPTGESPLSLESASAFGNDSDIAVYLADSAWLEQD